MEKFQLLCFMTQKLFAFAKGECAEENPDSPLTQEVMTSGHLYLLHLKVKINLQFDATTFRMTFGSCCVSDTYFEGLGADAFSFLHMHSGLGMMQESGLVVVADKLNSWRYLSHFRSVHRGASFAAMRTTTARRLLPAAWGFLCPVHTPDGTPCGLLNHLAAPCTVSSAPAGALGLPALLCSLGKTREMEPVDGCLRTSYSNYYPVLLDGAAVGWLPKDVAPVIANTLRAHKVRGDKVPSWMEIVLVPMLDEPGLYPALYLFTSPGRLLRPVWNLALNAQELIGTFEQIYLDVAVRAQEVLPGVSTHQELYPHTMLSIIANFIPFSDHNQSPRNMYECQMGKQTMGMPLYTFRDRTDNKLYRLQTPQSPLVRPYMYDYYGMDEYPLGTNAVVAVISYTGYDMEDAMNNKKWNRRKANNQLFTLNFFFLFFLILLITIIPISKESSVVDNIKACGNDTGTSNLKKVCITLRIPRNPMVGDKFASRHGQKGILSKLWPVEDMPFSESGMVPDIIFNPHGFPSRMTIGMLIESMAGKSAATHGLCHDATPFTFSESEPGIELLRTAGYNHLGTERMYSGLSGLELEADIFVGIVYYQRLRHMVSDKYQVRTTGARDRVTCQPVGGRQMQGGVRFGEMERDALLAHGTSFLLHDRLLACSDRSLARVCTRCCSLLSPCLEAPPPEWAQTRLGRRTWICKMCHQGDAIELIMIPFVFRYFIAEMAAINVQVHLNVA
uniref:DNA-directed RNA polymerase subunit beta n=1 Tax=Eptatretus burgeri TaxID=7764 RepID=A0A8C4X1E9_EPTBU